MCGLEILKKWKIDFFSRLILKLIFLIHTNDKFIIDEGLFQIALLDNSKIDAHMLVLHGKRQMVHSHGSY